MTLQERSETAEWCAADDANLYPISSDPDDASERLAFSIWLPQVPQSVLSISTALAVVIVIAMAGSELRVGWAHHDVLVDRLSYALDPTLIQFFSILVVAAIIVSYQIQFDDSAPDLRRKLVRFVKASAFVVFSLTATYALELLWLKPAFRYDRPSSFSEDSFFLHILRLTSNTHHTGCPSGFVLRQTWLILTGLAFASARSQRAPFYYWGNWGRRSIGMLALLGIATVLVAFLRIARSAHTPFDVAMGVATGTYLFWLVYYILTAASAALPQRLDADIFAISAVFLPLFVFYSQHAIYWSVSSIGIIIILGLVHYLTPFRAPRRP